MPLKVLLLNFPKVEVSKIPANVRITQSTIEQKPTLHDFHVIIIDALEIFNNKFWANGDNRSDVYKAGQLRNYNKKFKEQIETGGITFCFSSKPSLFFLSVLKAHGIPLPTSERDLDTFENYFWSPIDLGVIGESGDTFYPRFEELKYLAPLVKNIPIEDIKWDCYFSKVPENSKIFGTNRAGYSVFMEVPLGNGRLVLLPRFQDRAKAVTVIVNEVIPQMIHEEELTLLPKWLTEFSSTYEKRIWNSLDQIQKAKRLLFTKDKLLKKAVGFAFKKLGFAVNELPDGTLPDLELNDGKRKCLVEVKGHEKRQSTRKDVLQLLGYLSETDAEEKGIVVTNHEFVIHPDKRSAEAFTKGAIQLGKKNDFSLISTVHLYKLVMKVLEKEMDEPSIQTIRDKIMNESGLVQL